MAALTTLKKVLVATVLRGRCAVRARLRDLLSEEPRAEVRLFGPGRRWLSVVGLLMLTALGLGLRLAPLGRYVTPDEPFWVYRSIQFSDALAAGDWSAIPVTGHPGVTTMWLGAAGVLGRRLVAVGDAAADLDWIRRLAWLAPENGEAFRHLGPFLPWGRVAVALVTMLGAAALYPMIARLFDRRVAGFTVVLLLFDPFFIGHSGLLHTDALLATFGVLTLVSALNGLHEPGRRLWWALSGLFAALALLTKTPALTLFPYVLLLLLAGRIRAVVGDSASIPRSLSPIVLQGLLFAVSFSVVLIALYPALWSRPIGVLRTLLSFGGDHVRMAQRPIFFAGRMTYDPGPAFYPAVFLFRVSPVVLVGLVGAVLTWRTHSPDRRFALVSLLIFAILFTAGMSVGAKKHDRYLLPVFPVLTLVSALGMASWIDQYASRVMRYGGISIIIVQVVIALLFARYPLTYYNPLLGGPAVAAQVFASGWGEGAGVAARWLNERPNADRMTVAASNVPSFASLFRGDTIPLHEGLDSIALADYVVATSLGDRSSALPVWRSIDLPGQDTNVYTNTAPDRQAEYLSAYAGRDDLILLDADTPLRDVYDGPGKLVSGVSWPDEATVAERLAEEVSRHKMIWLVASPGASPITSGFVCRQLEAIATPASTATVSSATITRFVSRPSPSGSRPPAYRASFGGQLALVGAALPDIVSQPDSLDVLVRWQARGEPGTDYQALAALRDEEGHAWAVSESLVRNDVNFPTSSWEEHAWADDVHELRLPPGIPPGSYTVEISLYDRETGAKLGAVGPDGVFRGTQLQVGETEIARPAEPPRIDALAVPDRLDITIGPMTLLGVDPPASRVLSGDHVSFALFWQADASPGLNYDVRLEWVSPQGQIELQTSEPLSSFPTSQWQAGDRFQSHHRVPVQPGVPPGSYQLILRVTGPGGGTIGASGIPLGTIEVLPRERSFALPEGISHRTDVTFGERIHLRGYDVVTTETVPGGTLSLTLYWRADDVLGGPDRDYTLFVHLLGPDGLPHGQVDRIPGNGEAPTTSWAAGQVIAERIDLPVDVDAPVGQYEIAVGFYDASYGDRLPVISEAGEPLVDDRAILPLEITVCGDGP